MDVKSIEVADRLLEENEEDNWGEALEIYKKHPTNGQALFRAGRIIERHLGDDKRSEALEFFTKSATEYSNPESCYALGFHFIQQPKDFVKGIEYLEKGASLDHPKCLLLLSSIYSDDSADMASAHTSKEEKEIKLLNRARALDYCERSAKLNEPNAQVLLGTFYLEGELVSQSVEEATKWFNRAAENGSIEAKYQLGILPSSTPAEQQQSRSFLLEAANQGHASALYEVGNCLLKEAVEMEKEARGDKLDEAVKCLHYSAHEGNPLAQFQLFQLFSNGELLDKNHTLAYQYCAQAATNGHKSACLHIGNRLMQVGNEQPEKQDDYKESALFWWKKGATLGESRCKYLVGAHLSQKQETLQEGVLLLQEALQMGIEEAKEALNKIKEKNPSLF